MYTYKTVSTDDKGLQAFRHLKGLKAFRHLEVGYCKPPLRKTKMKQIGFKKSQPAKKQTSLK